MEAKDTVMTDQQIISVSNELGKDGAVFPIIDQFELRAYLRKQADITWDIARKEGMREVTESLTWESTSYYGTALVKVEMSKAEWQAQLKGWGIE